MDEYRVILNETAYRDLQDIFDYIDNYVAIYKIEGQQRIVRIVTILYQVTTPIMSKT